MITNYKSRKNEVLGSYETVEQLVSNLKEHAERVEFSISLESIEPLLADIRNKAKKIQADRFSLMVAGESKSGKSTFINAYLGVEILPMDVKQCTSAIIEIKNGKEFCVRATYADGRNEEIKGDSAAKEFLKKNAALDDEYRDIPVPTINSEILIKSGVSAKKKGVSIHISEIEVNELLNAPEVQDANIHNLSIADYNQKIRDYIEKKKINWQDIVTKIEVMLPLAEEMRGIEIIDSPGVCARGGVAEITSQYIERADAIIFLKPVSGQALESTQFNQFMRHASVERNKNALFLVLTRATSVPQEDLRRLELEAHKQFSNLDKKNILLVDSKAALYAKQFSTTDNIEAELRRLNENKTLDDFVVKAYSETTGFLGEGDFIKKLQEKSGFEKIFNSLDTFGRKAHYILLESMLESISRLYAKLWNDLYFHMNMLRQKAEDPTELAKKIAEVKQELDIINNKMSKGADAVVRRFCGDEGEIRKIADKSVEDFTDKVKLINEDSADSFQEIERLSFDKIDEFISLSESIQKKIVSEFDNELIMLSDKSTINFESLKPDFTEKIFSEIIKDAESKSNVTQHYKEGVTFKETKTRSVYSRNKHYRTIKTSIMTRLESIKNDLIENLCNFAEKIRSRYLDELYKNANAKKNELDVIMKAKANAEQIKKIISELIVLTERISSAKSDAEKIMGGIAKNVQ